MPCHLGEFQKGVKGEGKGRRRRERRIQEREILARVPRFHVIDRIQSLDT
jgi:hypothetical protein